MTQMTLRLTEETIRQVKNAAKARGVSVNRWATSVLEAAVNPDLAGDEAERLRERLSRAGLLHHPRPSSRPRPKPADVARARAAAGKGRLASDLVIEGRGP